MKLSKFFVLVITLLLLLFPLSHPVLGQDGPGTPSVPETPSADNNVYLPLVITSRSPTPPPGTSHPRTIDHRSVELFSSIPEQYLTSARNLKLLFSDRSVGSNIDIALGCLTASSWAAAPATCRNDYTDLANGYWRTFTLADWNNGIVSPRIQFAPDPVRYNRSNWTYEYRQGTWTELTQDFIQTTAPTYISRGYDILSYQFSYLNVLDFDNIANTTNGFFANNSNRYDIYDLEAFWAQHPDKIFILWTTSLARSTGTQVSTDFNNQMRSYAQAHNMWLFDVADIEAYTHTGEPCYDDRDGVAFYKRSVDGNVLSSENYPNDNQSLPAICQDYTTDVMDGHLGAVSGGGVRISKAFWVLMAKVAGWDGVSP